MSQSFRINTNVGALRAYNSLAKLNAQSQTAQLRLASQRRINNVADDTSGFNVGKSLDSKVTIMQSAQRNVGSAQDMLATAESQLISIKDMITQIRGKVADASNPTSDKAAIAKDIQAIADEIASAFGTTKFNETTLLQSVTNGAGAGFTFQTGVSSSDTININYGNVSGNELVGTGHTSSSYSSLTGLSQGVQEALDQLKGITSTTISDITDASAGKLEGFEDAVDASLGSIGNYSQRLQAKQEFLSSAILNSQSAYSRLFDADVALESLNATKSQIGSQAASAMFAQLNVAPQQVLQLFG
ncbi:MAG: flagellin [Ignavibacteriales bacterium]|nr:flagellin [Ignavibacteriales bacterium]MBK7980611.1 flagellin [Ignavibacteriota bacterium]